MFKLASSATLMTVALTGAEARKHSDKSSEPVDIYADDSIDVRPFLTGVGAFYGGFLEGLYKRGKIDEECLDVTTVTHSQDLMHMVLEGNFNDIGKLITDGQDLFNGIETCDFSNTFEGIFTHCDQFPQACEFDGIQARFTSHVMEFVASGQDLITTLSEMEDDESLELISEDMGKVGKDLGKIVKRVFDF